MTATIPEQELDVEFILWEAEDPFAGTCEANRKDCPNLALYRMFWVPSKQAKGMGFPVCLCGTNRLCLTCKDWVMNQERKDFEFYHCERCNGFADLKGIEPIRRG
jgi:hypothetical protein